VGHEHALHFQLGKQRQLTGKIRKKSASIGMATASRKLAAMSPKPPRKEGATSPQKRHRGIKTEFGPRPLSSYRIPDIRYSNAISLQAAFGCGYGEFDIYGSKFPLSVRARKGEAGSN